MTITGSFFRIMKMKLLQPDPVATGRRLDALRQALDMNQNEFSEAIGVDPSSYSKIKVGEKPFKNDMAYRAAERFDVSMDYFYRGRMDKIDPALRSKILQILGGQA